TAAALAEQEAREADALRTMEALADRAREQQELIALERERAVGAAASARSELFTVRSRLEEATAELRTTADALQAADGRARDLHAELSRREEALTAAADALAEAEVAQRRLTEQLGTTGAAAEEAARRAGAERETLSARAEEAERLLAAEGAAADALRGR
ncbi:unnamed protein product, partial [Phaeothamnion confervicola]